MATLETEAQIKAELAETADYDIAQSLDKAARRIAALRRRLDSIASVSRGTAGGGTESMAYEFSVVQRQLDAVLAWYRDNASASDAQRLRNPDVLHADFGAFHRYGSGVYR